MKQPSIDPVGEAGTGAVYRVMTDVSIITQLVSTELLRRIAPDLNLAEYGVLNHLVRWEVKNGAPRVESPTRLARLFQVTKPGMTATLAKLQAKGHVAIAGAETDRRQKLVTVTDRGRDAHRKALEAMAPLAAGWLEGFGRERFEALRPMLSELREFLDTARNAQDGL